MRDVLYEESVNPSNLKFQKIAYIFYTVFFWLLIIIGSVFLLFAFEIYWSFIIFAAFMYLSAVLIAFIKRRFYYCVDYVFVSGSTRIVKVINYKRRKLIIKFESEEVYQLGNADSESFNKLFSDPNVKKIYATPNKYSESLKYVAVKHDGINYLVIMECKEDYFVNLVSFTGKRVIEKEYK